MTLEAMVENIMFMCEELVAQTQYINSLTNILIWVGASLMISQCITVFLLAVTLMRGRSDK